MSPFAPESRPPLDVAIIAAWTQALLADNPEPIRAVFRSHGAEGPVVIWRPDPMTVVQPPLRFVLAHWQSLAGDRPMPLARQIDALALRPALGYLSLLDVVEGGADFRYRLFGTIASAVTGFDMTRRLLSQHQASAYMVQYFFAVYRAMLQRQEPVYTQHRPPAAVKTNAWHRVALPLADEAGAVIRFLVANVPVGHDGRIINTGL
jgi:PAS domain